MWSGSVGGRRPTGRAYCPPRVWQVERSFRIGRRRVIARWWDARRVTTAIEDASHIDYLPLQPDHDRNVLITISAGSRSSRVAVTASIIRVIEHITFHRNGSGTGYA